MSRRGGSIEATRLRDTMLIMYSYVRGWSANENAEISRTMLEYKQMGINMLLHVYTVIVERTWNKFLQATHMEAFIIQTYGPHYAVIYISLQEAYAPSLL